MVRVSERVIHLMQQLVESILIISGDCQLNRDVDFVVFHRADIMVYKI
jgi:hypothetical protein